MIGDGSEAVHEWRGLVLRALGALHLGRIDDAIRALDVLLNATRPPSPSRVSSEVMVIHERRDRVLGRVDVERGIADACRRWAARAGMPVELWLGDGLLVLADNGLPVLSMARDGVAQSRSDR